MYELAQLEKQQVGLRLPKYLIDEIDSMTKEYSLNRSDIITESIKAFIIEQKMKTFYKNIDISCKEVNDIISNKTKETSLQELIDEL